MLAIRADGNKRIGSGHVMRCMAIAKAYRNMGEECAFICADASLKEFIEKNGFDAYILGTDFADMESELDSMIQMLKDLEADKVLVDSYFSTDIYLETLRDRFFVAVMDDYGNRVIPADLVINYNVFASQDSYEKLYEKESTSICTGLDYAPLRDEFIGLPQKNISEKFSEALILTGGADPEHVAVKLAKVISESDSDIHYSIVAGALSSDIEKLREIEAKCSNITVHVNISNIHELMQKADVAITASGSTAYELCACGTPMITYVLADNQIKASIALKEKAVSLYAGDAREAGFEDRVFEELNILIKDKDKREKMSAVAASLVDGHGAERLAGVLR